ncbi:hypothetical protein [Pseudomonas sp. Irchel s3h17]|uniref:hypothetical protein n=1 Tax=Pseudomonas sp. Irchel s3h17 TaxID=2009182 RepID=UPI000BA34CB7|nr:hypothetical protein [Pseudomonas sp. Irchel s3h17]
MNNQTLTDATDEWSMEILGVRFVEGTASDFLTSFIVTSTVIFFYYGIFRLFRMRWGIYQSLGATYALIHIIPPVTLWIIKRALYSN